MILGFLSSDLVTLHIFFEMFFPNQEFDLILQLGTSLRYMPNIFMVGAILTPVHVVGLERRTLDSLAISFMIYFLLIVRGCNRGIFGRFVI